MRSITKAVIHCSVTRPGWMKDRSVEEKRDEIQRWHVEENGWKSIGYHYIIDRDGSIAEGRNLATPGAHVKGHNASSIGICLLGGYGCEKDDAFGEHFTIEQGQALRALIEDLQSRFGIKKILGHNELASKACPGFDVQSWLKKKPRKPKRNNPVQSSTVRASGLSIAGSGGLLATLMTQASSLDPTAQYLLLGGGLVVLLAGMWILKERLVAWSKGWK